jgi:hypothetical protein
MRSLTCLLAVGAATVLVATAAAQIELPPTGSDQVGFYTQPDFDGENAVFVEADLYSLIDVHLVLSGLSVNSVAAFECLVGFAGPSLIVNSVFPVEHINVATPPEYIVGFGAPIPAVDGVVALVRITFLLLAEEEYLFLGPVSVPSIPGAMAYLDGDDYAHIVVMYPSSGSFDAPVFAVNTMDVIATEDRSWSEVRQLYR